YPAGHRSQTAAAGYAAACGPAAVIKESPAILPGSPCKRGSIFMFPFGRGILFDVLRSVLSRDARFFLLYILFREFVQLNVCRRRREDDEGVVLRLFLFGRLLLGIGNDEVEQDR